MKKAYSKSTSVSNLKANLSRVLADIAKGAEYTVTDHNKPVAKLVSLHKSPPLVKFDINAIYNMKPIALPKGAKTSEEIVRQLRDEE